MVALQGEVWWADLGPRVDEYRLAGRRPVVVVQGDSFNRSNIATVVIVAMTANLSRAAAPGNVLLVPGLTGLPQPSVANVSQLTTVSKRALSNRVGQLPADGLQLILAGIDLMLGRGQKKNPAG